MSDLKVAIEKALSELGVPGPGYPAPVANAVHILSCAVGRPTKHEADEWDGDGRFHCIICDGWISKYEGDE